MKTRGHPRFVDEHQRRSLVCEELRPDHLHDDGTDKSVLGHENTIMSKADAVIEQIDAMRGGK